MISKKAAFVRLARLVLATGVLATAGAAQALNISLPGETASYKESTLPGYALVQRNCMTCHSAQYVLTQPPLARGYWEATVKKMKKPFGATFPDAEIPDMVDYLVTTYGVSTRPPTAAAGK